MARKHKVKYPCQYHKVSENRTINTINYLVNGWRTFRGHRFLGFIQTFEDAITSLKIDDVNYIACHLFFFDKPYLIAPEGQEDTAEIAKKKPWILMFMGNDDSSYAKRFGTRMQALTAFEEMEIFSEFFAHQCWMYN